MTDGAPSVDEVTVRPATAAEILDLRHRVLRAGHPRETAVFPCDALATTRHFAAVAGDGRVIGCCTFQPSVLDGEPAWQLRGMATDPAWAGRGVGRRVLTAAAAAVTAGGPRLLWCNARHRAVGFYQRLGWVICSDSFDLPLAGPHYRMRGLPPVADNP